MKIDRMISSRTAVVLAVVAMAGSAFVREVPGKNAPPETATGPHAVPMVQIALLLDTSNSMDGLIGQAKTQLWKVVNEFIGAKQDGLTPEVHVALYEYGNQGLSAEENWIRCVQPLTRDLDRVSEELFGLTTDGGEEYCGAVIERATQELGWDPSPKVYKAIFIAGNEPFTQGAIDPEASCKNAISRGIIVNTIHCGSEADGLKGRWKDGALVADGTFISIDQNESLAHIPAPQDAEIERLNVLLNQTFLPFGAEGVAAKQRQEVQDSNASDNRAVGALVNRVICKASSNYFNGNWDLVDATKNGKFDLSKLKAAELPEAMRKLSLNERHRYVERVADERAEIQKKILALNSERETFVARHREVSGGAETLDSAVVKTVREQAGEKAFQFAN